MNYFLISRLGISSKSFKLSRFILRRFKFLRHFGMLYTGCYEQSLAAYNKAFEKGYHTMLFDVRQTKDHHFVCWHDDDVSDVAFYGNNHIGDKWLISEHTIDEVRALTICKGILNWGGQIVMLDEILSFCKEKSLMAEVEIKSYLDNQGCFDLAQRIKKYEMDDMVIIHRNHGEPDMLGNLSQLMPKAYFSCTGNNIEAMERMIRLKIVGKKLLTITNYKGFIPETLRKEHLERLHRAGIGVIFSEVKREKDKKIISKIAPYLQFVASRFRNLGIDFQ